MTTLSSCSISSVRSCACEALSVQKPDNTLNTDRPKACAFGPHRACAARAR